MATMTDAPPIAWRRRAALILVLGLAAVVMLVWLQRKPIASGFIERELARRGVAARYDLAAVGLRTQRIERVSLGDPRAPDLTADWIEIDVQPRFGVPAVSAVRASC